MCILLKQDLERFRQPYHASKEEALRKTFYEKSITRLNYFWHTFTRYLIRIIMGNLTADLLLMTMPEFHLLVFHHDQFQGAKDLEVQTVSYYKENKYTCGHNPNVKLVDTSSEMTLIREHT